MSESSSKRGPKRRFTDSERKHRKRESNAKLSNLSRIWIGDQCDRWNELRSVFYEWNPTLKWRKYFWTGKCNVYILTMKINRTLWLIEVIDLFRRWKHWRKYIFIYHLYLTPSIRTLGTGSNTKNWVRQDTTTFSGGYTIFYPQRPSAILTTEIYWHIVFAINVLGLCQVLSIISR